VGWNNDSKRIARQACQRLDSVERHRCVVGDDRAHHGDTANEKLAWIRTSRVCELGKADSTAGARYVDHLDRTGLADFNHDLLDGAGSPVPTTAGAGWSNDGHFTKRRCILCNSAAHAQAECGDTAANELCKHIHGASQYWT